MHDILIHIIEALLAKFIEWQIRRLYEKLKDKSKCAVCEYDKNGIRMTNHLTCLYGEEADTPLCYDCTKDFARLLNKETEKLPRLLRQPCPKE